MVAEIVAICGGLNISIFRSEDDQKWYWYFTDKPDDEPVGPYESRWAAWCDANDTEEKYGTA